SGGLTITVAEQGDRAGLMVGNDGLIYGVTTGGGPSGFGTAFRMTTSGTLTNFALLDGQNGRSPLGGLVLASDGNFYGTSHGGGAFGDGAVFRISPAGVVTLLFSFDGGDSLWGCPDTSLTLGPEGNLSGITSFACPRPPRTSF